MAEYAIGVDLGGTNLRAAAIDREGKILEKISGSTKLSAGGTRSSTTSSDRSSPCVTSSAPPGSPESASEYPASS